MVLALRPEGCVAEACLGSGVPPRPSEDLAWWFAIAVAAMAAAASLAGRNRSDGRLVRIGAVVLWLAVGLLVVGVAVNRGVAVDAPLWWLHDTDTLGRVLPLIGTALIGAGLLRSAPVLGVLLIGAALAGLPFNAQDSRVLFDLPLGVAWVVLGCWWTARRRTPLSVPG